MTLAAAAGLILCELLLSGKILIKFDVESGHRCMGLHGGVLALKFDGLFGAGDWVDRSAQDIAFGVTVDVAGGLLDFNQLRLALKSVEQKNA